MVFTIRGIDRLTGRASEALIDAPSEQDAIRRAAELGIVVPGYEAIAEEVRAANAAVEVERRRAELAGNACPHCGSTKVIPNLSLHADVRGLEVGGTNRVDVVWWGSPAGAVQVALTVRVCGDCGHVELHARDFRWLCERYEQFRQS